MCKTGTLVKIMERVQKIARKLLRITFQTVLSWYFSCRNTSEMCAVNEINAAIPIMCVPFNRTSGIWIVDYNALFEVAVVVVVVVDIDVDSVHIQLKSSYLPKKLDLSQFISLFKKYFPYRELNPGLLGESQLS
jgi:hypothetical protein